MSRGLGRRIHESVEDTKLSTNKQHTLSLWRPMGTTEVQLPRRASTTKSHYASVRAHPASEKSNLSENRLLACAFPGVQDNTTVPKLKGVSKRAPNVAATRLGAGELVRTVCVPDLPMGPGDARPQLAVVRRHSHVVVAARHFSYLLTPSSPLQLSLSTHRKV